LQTECCARRLLQVSSRPGRVDISLLGNERKACPST